MISKTLNTRHAPLLLALLAMLLTLPSLWVGWQFDDYLHRQTILDAGISTVLMNLFVFMDGDPAHTRHLMDSGAFPWWALAEGKVAFWRPLSALTHWIDYQLWPKQPILMHTHNILWFGALIAAVALLYRQLMPTTSLATLAAFLYTIDDAHGFAVGWLSNRNGLLAAFFGVLAIYAHDRWRRAARGEERFSRSARHKTTEARASGRLRPYWWALISSLLLMLGLLSAEGAIATVAYLVAYALFLERGTPITSRTLAPTPDPALRIGGGEFKWWPRLLTLWPATLTVILWRLIYRVLGYGAWGTSYIDPLGEPWRYAQAVIERVPILLLAQWALPPAELYPFLPTTLTRWLWLVAVALLLLGLLVLQRADGFWRSFLLTTSSQKGVCSGQESKREALRLQRFWLTGMLLATLPPSASLPANRLLFFIGLGAMGLLAQFIHSYTNITNRACPTMLVLAIHLVLAPLMLPFTAFSPALWGNIEPSINSLPTDSEFAQQDAIIVNAPTFFATGYIAHIRAFNGQPVNHVRFLGADLSALEVIRHDVYTLIVRPENGYITGFDPVFRGDNHPMRVGDTVELAGLRVEVMDVTEDGRPAMVAFRFEVPLEDPSLRWLQWKEGVYVPFVLPDVGERVKIPAIKPPSVSYSECMSRLVWG